MKRLPDWQLRLEQFMRARRSVPFAWGSNDCATFAADCVEAMTGVRLLAEMRDYASPRDAIRLIDQAGGLRGVATHALGGFVLPAYASVGDVVLVPMGKREALGICNGGVVLGPTRQGLGFAPLKGAKAAWRVG